MGVVKNLMVRAGADFSAITKQSKKASASLKSMSATASTVGSTMRKALGAVGMAVSIGAIVAASKDAAEAFKAQSEAEAKVAQVMRNTMGASAAEVKSIKELCSAQQDLGVIGDEVQLAGAQELATYLSQTATLKKLIPVMNDMVAQQYGYEASAESAANIATMLGKVMDGQTGALSRYGYSFTEAQEQILKFGTEEQRAATLAEVVEASVGGMNAALAQTPTGRMQQLSNTLGDIKEMFGQAVMTIATTFLPLLNRVASMLATVANVANKVAQSIANVFGKKLTTSAVTVASGASGAAESYDSMAESAEGAGKAAKEAAKSVLGFDVLNKLSDNSASSSGSGSGSAEGKSGSGVSGGLIEEEETAESSTKLEKALQRVKDLISSINFEPLKNAAERVKEAFSGLADVISGALSWAFDNVLSPLATWTIEDAAPAALETLAGAIDLVKAAAKKASAPLKTLWDDFLAPVANWVGDTFVTTLESISSTLGKITDLLEGNTTFSEFLDSLTPLESALTSVGTAALVVFGGMALVNGVLTTVTTTVGLVKGAFTLLSNPIGIAILAIAGLVLAGIWLYQNWDTVKEKISEIWDKIKTKFQEGKEEIQGDIDRIKEFFAGLRDKWTEIKEAVAQKWEELKTKFQEGKEELQGDIDRIKEFFAGLGDKWEEIKENIAQKWEELKGKFRVGRDTIHNAIRSIKGFFTSLGEKWKEIKESISEKIQELQDKWEDFKAKFGEAKDAICGFAEDLWSRVSAPFASISGAIEGIISACQTAIGWLDDLFGAGGKADQLYESNLAAGGGLYNTVPWDAEGGLHNAGQLFFAREAGPELVGTIGNQSAVVNNDQIVEAVSRGVAVAVAQVLNSGQRRSGGETKFYLNGKEFARAVYSDMKAVSSEKGFSLVNA